MGNYVSIIFHMQNEIKDIRERNEFLHDKLESMYERTGKLEKDIINTQINVNLQKENLQFVTNRIMNIDLLEEGRSYIGNRKRHTASEYKK